MQNTRNNALTEGIKERHSENVRKSLEDWALDGENFSVIQDEVENIMVELQDFMYFNDIEVNR
jgi:hypothetical protein